MLEAYNSLILNRRIGLSVHIKGFAEASSPLLQFSSPDVQCSSSRQFVSMEEEKIPS